MMKLRHKAVSRHLFYWEPVRYLASMEPLAEHASFQRQDMERIANGGLIDLIRKISDPGPS